MPIKVQVHSGGSDVYYEATSVKKVLLPLALGKKQSRASIFSSVFCSDLIVVRYPGLKPDKGWQTIYAPACKQG